jgi:hypothetical protein
MHKKAVVVELQQIWLLLRLVQEQQLQKHCLLEETNVDSCSVPNGSLVVLNLEVSKETSIDEINAIMKNMRRRLVEQIKYSTNNELVSSDIVGTGTDL